MRKYTGFFALGFVLLAVGYVLAAGWSPGQKITQNFVLAGSNAAGDAAPTARALVAADLPLVTAAKGGTGVSNTGTITNASNTTITGGGTIALGGFTATIPATGTTALIGTANVFTQTNSFTAANALKLGAASVSFFVQDATPTALATDDLWYETDTNIIWFWNGTYWLSMNLFICTANSSASIGTAGNQWLLVDPIAAADFDIYMVDSFGSIYVETTNDGTHYWSFQLKKYTGSVSGTGLGSAYDTSADTVNNFVRHKVSVNTFVDLTGDVKVFSIDTSKVSTPGPWYGQTGFSYRLAHR